MIGAGDKEYTNAYMTKKNRTVITVWKMTEKGVRGGQRRSLGSSGETRRKNKSCIYFHVEGTASAKALQQECDGCAMMKNKKRTI